MPNITEIRITQKNQLFIYLKLERDNSAAGITVIGLDEQILQLETAMVAEDVAWVREKISQLP